MDKYTVNQIDLNAGHEYNNCILNTTVVIDEEYNEVDLQKLSEDDRMEIEEDLIDDVNGDESVGKGEGEEEESDTSFKQYTLKATCGV